MNYEEFKNLSENNKKIYDEKIKSWEELRTAQEEKYDKKTYSPRSRFSLFGLGSILVCPVCGKDLEYEHLRTTEKYGEHHVYKEEDGIYFCTCGYQFANRC